MRSAGISYFLAFQLALTAPAQSPPPEKLTIAVIEGEGAIHNLRHRTASALTVQIVDENKRPVEGATVTFTLPSEGAGGSFSQGAVAMATSDGQGKVVVGGFRPNNISGKMEIRVTASYQGQVAHATITQFNMMVEPAGQKPAGHNKKVIAILLIVGAAAAGGAVAASSHKSSSAPGAAPTPTTIGITPGTGTVGAPQ